MKNKTAIQERIEIKAELSLPLEELALYTVKKKQGEQITDITGILYSEPERANEEMRKIIRGIIGKKKLKIQLMEVKFAYNDSDNLTHGASYFDVKLLGTKDELRRLAGENKLFYYEWKK